MYLIESDYAKGIREEVLEIVQGTVNARIDAEITAISEADSYLSVRYDTSRIFIDLNAWVASATYATGDAVLFDPGSWNITTAYQVGNMVRFDAGRNLRLYRALSNNTASTPTTSTAAWQDLGIYIGIWRALDDHSGFEPTDASHWLHGDPRNPVIRSYVIDITLYHLHSRISPRMIPELREERYRAAIAWLKGVAAGNINVPDLPLLEDAAQAPGFRFGSGPKKSHYL